MPESPPENGNGEIARLLEQVGDLQREVTDLKVALLGRANELLTSHREIRELNERMSQAVTTALTRENSYKDEVRYLRSWLDLERERCDQATERVHELSLVVGKELLAARGRG